jgi:septal ring factor EnvC (AmiA/AmiB activator)
VQQEQQKLNETEQKLVQLTDMIVSRNKDLAAVDGQLQNARQETAEMQAKLAAMGQDLARQPAPVPPANAAASPPAAR